MIPKVIYYAWFGRKEKPKFVEDNIQSWKKYNPEFKIVEINEDNFDISKYKFVQDAYRAKKWAFVSDVVRIDVIYQNGGIYLDTDVEAIKSFDFLLKNTAFWGLENSNAVNSGLIFGAQKHFRTLQQILNVYSNTTFRDDQYISEVMTVPIITKVLLDKGLKVKNKTQRLYDDSVVYSTYFFAPYHFWGGGRIRKQTVTIHHYTASWLPQSENLSKMNLKTLKRWGIYFCPKLVELFDRLRGKHSMR